jgi:glycolate oxidase FAD binding subunit
MSERPDSVPQLQEAVRALASVRFLGSGSKTGLRPSANEGTRLELVNISGIVEYRPDECIISARAGTRLTDIDAALSAHGHYLPFDPPLVDAGASLGGTIAAGLSGPGRYRYGGVRDFLLGAAFVDGSGRLIRSGGKVVKNAAGFYLHNMLVGSLGRFGALVEMTVKVFPQPDARVTVRGDFPGQPAALDALARVATGKLDCEALDFEPPATIWARIAGFAEALPPRVERLRAVMGGETHTIAAAEDEDCWRRAREFSWVPDGTPLVKIATTPERIESLERRFAADEGRRRYSVGGNVAWIAWRGSLDALDKILGEEGLAGLVVLGEPRCALIGAPTKTDFSRRIKQALDPEGRFGEL